MSRESTCWFCSLKQSTHSMDGTHVKDYLKELFLLYWPTYSDESTDVSEFKCFSEITALLSYSLFVGLCLEDVKKNLVERHGAT